MNDQDEPVRMSLSEHFEELRTRLLWAFGGLAIGILVCWFFKDRLMHFVLEPLRNANYDRELLNLSPMEQILQYLKVSIVFGLILTSPWIAHQMWQFISAGLYEAERKITYVYAGGSVLLFLIGVAFSYWIMLPLVMRVLIGFDPADVSDETMQFAEYVDFFFKTTLAMGVSFQVPIVMRFLSAMNLVGKETWTAYRKYAIVSAFLIAALITPPDPVSQISAGLPIAILYEVGILLIPASPDRKMDSSSGPSGEPPRNDHQQEADGE